MRLPAIVTEASLLAALSASDAAMLRDAAQVSMFAFVAGKAPSKNAVKRLSLCWIAFMDAAAVMPFCRRNANLSFVDATTNRPFGVQLDLALHQQTAPMRAPGSADVVLGDDDPDFAAFRAIYDAGDVPLLGDVVTSDSKPTVDVAPTAAAAAAPQNTPLVEMVLADIEAAESRKAMAKRDAAGGKKKKQKGRGNAPAVVKAAASKHNRRGKRKAPSQQQQ